MSWIITKMKNDLWNIWSTNSDSFVLDEDCPLVVVESVVLEQEIERVKESTKLRFDSIKQGNKVYFKTEDYINENYKE